MIRLMLAVLLSLGCLSGSLSAQQTQSGTVGQPAYSVQPYDGQVLTTPGATVWDGPPCPPADSLFGLGAGQNCFNSYTGWIGGAGVYYIKPAWDNNQAYVQAQSDGAGTTTSTRTDFDYGYEFAPQAWLGYVGTSGFGVRGRWWMFDHSADSISFADPADGTIFLAQAPLLYLPTFLSGSPGTLVPVFVGGPGAQYTFQSNLDLYAIDLEGVQVIEHEQWTWVFSGGVRYAHIAQKYNVYVNNGAAFENMVSGHNFNGLGPTVSLEGRRNIGMTGFALYANARGSILGGDGKQSVQVSRSAGGGTFLNASSQNWEILSIGELEVGTEWSRLLGVAKFFVRGGFVGQVWHSAGNASNTGLDGLPDDNTNLGFYGFRLALGVDY
jgi:hypothetical protein